MDKTSNFRTVPKFVTVDLQQYTISCRRF